MFNGTSNVTSTKLFLKYTYIYMYDDIRVCKLVFNEYVSTQFFYEF